MWIPVSIRVKNIFTHEDTFYSFKPKEFSVFLGINRDKKGANSNGSGKSGLIEAIHIAILGESCRNITADKFIRKGTDEAEVEMILKNNVLGKEMIITRKFFRDKDKSSKIQLKFNGKPWKKQVSINDGNRQILIELGLSKEDIKNYHIIGQRTKGEGKIFFQSGDSKQKEIISRLSNSSIVDKLIENLEQNVDTIEKENLKDIDTDLIRANTLIESYNEEIENLANFDNSDEKEMIENNIQSFKEKQETKAEEKIKLQSEKTKKEAELKKLQEKSKNQNNLQELKDEKSNYNNSIELEEGQAQSLKSKNSKFKTLLGGEVECPKCKQKFVPKSELSIKQINDNIKANDELITKINENIEELESKKEKIDEQIKQIRIHNQKVEEAQSDVNDFDRKLKRIEDDQKYYKEKIVGLKEELETLKKNDASILRRKELKGKINKQQETIEILISKKSKIQQEIEELKKLMFHLGKSGFKTYLANLSIRNIQDVINFYLNKFQMDVQIKINGYTVLKSGELRDKIEAIIVEDGVEDFVYEQNSGGETSRIDIASILALHTLNNNSCDYGKGLDMLCIDEGIPYLDGNGQLNVIKMLEQSGITCIAVMHQIEDIQTKNQVYFVRKNKKTTISLSKPKDFSKRTNEAA